MSLMIESLLLHAQSLRERGLNDESMAAFSTVISMCDAAIDSAPSSSSSSSSSSDGRGDIDDDDDRRTFSIVVNRRMRDASRLALAIMLLQRAGRRSSSGRGGGRRWNGDVDHRDHDERRADVLLRRLGYRIRLSALAFGYSNCSSLACRRHPSPSSPSSPRFRDEVASAEHGAWSSSSLLSSSSSLLSSSSSSSSSSSPPSSTSTVAGSSRRGLADAVHVVDDALPASMYRALKYAFRPMSRYWNDVHSRVALGGGTYDDDDDGDPLMRERGGDHGVDYDDDDCYDVEGGDRAPRASKRRRANTDDDDDDGGDDHHHHRRSRRRHCRSTFVSHNIPLPPLGTICGNDARATLSDAMRRSRSVLEQAAIVISRRRLMRRFPDIENATSVEVWCHIRSRDHGGHRLHYDMDEIRLWDRRRRKMAGIGGSWDGPRTTHSHKDDDDNEVDDDDGVQCPIVSCVLTIAIPDDSCLLCGGALNSSPTIVCDQSILVNRRRRRYRRRDGTVRGGEGTRISSNYNDNVGRLCFPRPNRLLAFDGSLLHGVLPGMTSQRLVRPTMGAPSRDDDSDSYREEDGGGSNDEDDENDDDGDLIEEANDDVENHRITLMMGFWKDVRTTTTIGADASTSFGANGRSTIGPNVPYLPREGTWTEEFEPIPVSGDDLAGMESTSVRTDETIDGLEMIHPLWIPITDGDTTAKDATSIGVNSRHDGDDGIQFSSRFFLKSMDPKDIDDEVLFGT